MHVVQTSTIPEKLRLHVALPADSDGASCYPVVYLLDAHWFFPLAHDMVRLLEEARELPPLVLVGIGYDLPGDSPRGAEERASDLRCRDLTPTPDVTEWWRKAGADRPLGGALETGGGGAFLRVIEEEVKPLMRRLYPCDAQDETLAGFSLGGLFALQVLFQNPACFRRYIAGSPSLWWDNGAIFSIEERYAASHEDLDKTIFLSVGGEEQSGSAAPCAMVSNFKRLEDRLRSRRYPSLKWRAVILDGDTHASAPARTFTQGLQTVFGLDPVVVAGPPSCP